MPTLPTTTRLYDGFTSLVGGMNEGVDPSIANTSQYSRGVNIQNRKGLIKTREGWTTVATIAGASSTSFQGCFLYRLEDADRLVYAIAGVVKVLNLSTLVTTTIATLSTTASKFYFCKADRYCVVQDGSSTPIVFEQETLYTGAKSIPIGFCMAYGHSRLFVNPLKVATTNEGRPYFLAGDVFQADSPTSILFFKETEYLGEGGGQGLANEMGYIKGMGFLRNAATGSGLGTLIIFARDGVSSFSVNIPRSSWKDVDFSHVLFFGPGAVSDRAILSINNDLVYRAEDGLRTINYSGSETSSSLVNLPLSNEVKSFIDVDTGSSLAFCSMAHADNKLYFTCNYDSTTNCSNGIVSLDFANASTLGTPITPSYDGLYTGFNVLQIFSAYYQGKNKLHALIKKGSDILVCALVDSNKIDLASTDITSRVYTNTFYFGNPGTDKKMVYAELWVKDILGSVDINIYWKPDGYEYWLLLGSAAIKGSTSVAEERRLRAD